MKKFNWQKDKIMKAKDHQYDAQDKINNIIIKERKGKIFVLSDGSECVEFMCCSYLGLDLDKRIINAGKKILEKLGVNIAISRTRIRSERFDLLDNYLNEIFCHNYTTVFSSLHILHAGIIPLISSGQLPSYPIKENGCLFIIDKFAHASIKITRGIMEQIGEVALVDLQDLELIEKNFKKAALNHQTPISLSDSINSMGGIAPIKKLLSFAEKHSGYVYLDDAHGTSIVGKNGCGYTLNLLNNQYHPKLILAGSLSKGFGTNAAVIILPTKKDIDMVRAFCFPYIFSNPPALAIVESSIASAKIHLTPEINLLQKKLWENVALISQRLKKYLLDYAEPSPIKRILVQDEYRAIETASELKRRGFLVSPAMFPSVARNKAILRIVISAIHTEKQINMLADNIIDILEP